MKQYLASFFYILISFFVSYGQYPPAAGQPGSTAIAADSNVFISWATNCIVVRGYVRLDDTTYTVNGSNKASWGSDADATGPADNNVVSLGDKGYAICTFDPPITNGPGWDFAVFENSFNDTFLELAFVEVSSDGVHFFRFPASSLTPIDEQIPTFGSLDPTQINNLAGKYRAFYGTPFDLDSLPDHPLLNKQAITHVKIIDVGGSIIPELASYDHAGRIINDPFPTPFASSGFDLDAIGVIHNTNSINNFSHYCSIYPNPASTILHIRTSTPIFQMHILTTTGQIVLFASNKHQIDISHLPEAVYIAKITLIDGTTLSKLFLKQ